MPPLEVVANGLTRKLGPKGRSWKTPDDMIISWSGDATSWAHVYDQSLTLKGRWYMPLPGLKTEISYYGYVAPIEFGEPSTPVTRRIRLKRT